jgi:hypothetical protein
MEYPAKMNRPDASGFSKRSRLSRNANTGAALANGVVVD